MFVPGTTISAISLRDLQTGVAVPSSDNASQAAKKDAADFLRKNVNRKKSSIMIRIRVST